MSMNRVSRRGLVIAVAAAVGTACSSSVPIPEGAQLTCSSASDCPSGFACHNQVCARLEAMDTTPPYLVKRECGQEPQADACVCARRSPGSEATCGSAVVGKAGATFTIDLVGSEALVEPPRVTLGVIPLVDVPCVANGEDSYRCTYTATGAENGGRGGVVGIDVALKDRAGNESLLDRVAALELDFAPAGVALASVAYYPDTSNPLPSVARAKVGTVVRVAVTANEDLDLTVAPTLGVDFGGVFEPFALVTGSLTRAGAVFEGAVPSGTQDGSFTPTVGWTDLAGNATTTGVGMQAIVVKAHPPSLVVNQGKVVFVRSPWGASAPENLGGYTLPPGSYFGLEPVDTTSPSPTLDANTFSLADVSSPSAVLVKQSAARNALVLGKLWPNADGTWPRQPLSSPDIVTVYVVGVDDAGNESLPVRITNAEWVATPNPPAMGTNPHSLEWVGYVGSSRQQDTDVHFGGTFPATGIDGYPILARAEAAWHNTTGGWPGSRAFHAMAYDSARGRVVLFGGNADTWEWDGYAWSQFAAAGPSARTSHAMAYDSARGRVVLFGGVDVNGYCGDTWEWSGSAWTAVATTGPTPRKFHAMAYDSRQGVVVLFGGLDASGRRGDTWKWSGNAWSQVAATGPSPRDDHAMAYDGRRGRLVLFGGWDSSGQRADTWEWDGSSWGSAPVATTGPSPRSDHAMAYDGARGQVVLFGGRDASGDRSDTWQWSGSGWTLVATSGPGARSYTAVAFDGARGQVVLFGGRANPNTLFDTWVWSGNGWSQVATSSPSARNSSAMAYDPGRGRMVLFGGYDSTGYRGDTWEWDGFGWKPIPFATGPSPRMSHAMAYDSIQRRIVLFGGQGAAGDRGDTWEWDGTSWTSVATGGPSARDGHKMASDSARGRVVLFGGFDATGFRGDTWEWNGSSWGAGPVATTGPTARLDHAMAYDGTRSLLFGGREYSGLDDGDTWAWSGSGWTPLYGGLPGPRRGHAVAYDSGRGGLVLFGGDHSNFTGGRDSLQDTWDREGAWKDVSTQGPSARTGHAMAYDVARARVVLFGGVVGGSFSGNFSGETWLWDASPDRQSAIQFDVVATGAGFSPADIEGLRVRTFAGGTSQGGGTGATLLGWARSGLNGEPGTWEALGANQVGIASPPTGGSASLPGGSTSLLEWRAASPDDARRLLVERDGRLSFQVRPSGTAGSVMDGAQVALDYIEARVRYATSPSDAAPHFVSSYSNSPAVYAANLAIPRNVPRINDQGLVTYFSVSPALPPGLRLDDMTGVIFGTPTAPSPATTYTVTATNAGGSEAIPLSIRVMEDPHVPPAGLVYSVNPATYYVGQSFANSVPSSTGGGGLSYSVSPSLPAGLSIDPSTGVLSGAPTAMSPTTSYTVTATNLGGSTAATLTITVNGCQLGSLCNGDPYQGGQACFPSGLCDFCSVNADCPPPTNTCDFDGLCKVIWY
jgi:hypothetical protein